MLEIVNETSTSHMKVRRLFVVRFFFIKNLQCFVHNPLLFRLSNSIISKGRMQRTRLFRQEPISFVLRGFSAAFWKRCEQKNANWNHGLSLIQIILVLIIMNLNCSKLHDLSLLTSWKIIKLPFGLVNVGDPGICIHAYLKSYSRNWWSFEPIESLPFFTLAERSWKHTCNMWTKPNNYNTCIYTLWWKTL